MATQIRDLNVAFPARDVMTDQERSVSCIAANASKMVLTPGQAKCYASNFLGERIDTLLQQGVSTQAARDALSRGNTLRALMQTSVTMNGFSDHTRYIADVAYIASAVFALAGLAGLAQWSTEQEVAEPAKSLQKLRRKPVTA
jgi:hypothetical protein